MTEEIHEIRPGLWTWTGKAILLTVPRAAFEASLDA